MLLGLLYSVVRSLLELLVLCQKTQVTLQIEVLALRHQLRVLERQVRRRRFQPGHRLLLSALSRILPRPAWRAFPVSPETLYPLLTDTAYEQGTPAGTTVVHKIAILDAEANDAALVRGARAAPTCWRCAPRAAAGPWWRA